MNTFISAVLVGLVGVFCMWDSRLLGRLNFEQPLVGATLVGLLLGDVPTGLAVYRMHICAGSGLYAIMYFLPIFLAVFVGTDLVQAIVNMVPEWLSTGLNVSTKIMTAYGLALLLTMMIKKGMTPFLFIGFLLAAYLNLSVIAVALIGVCLAVVFMGFKFNGSHAAAGVDSDYDPLEDDED